MLGGIIPKMIGIGGIIWSSKKWLNVRRWQCAAYPTRKIGWYCWEWQNLKSGDLTWFPLRKWGMPGGMLVSAGLAGPCTIVDLCCCSCCQNSYGSHRSPSFGDVPVHMYYPSVIKDGWEIPHEWSFHRENHPSKSSIRDILHCRIGMRIGLLKNGVPQNSMVYHGAKIINFQTEVTDRCGSETSPTSSCRIHVPTRGVLGEAEEKCWNQKRVLELGPVFGYARHAFMIHQICIHDHTYIQTYLRMFAAKIYVLTHSEHRSVSAFSIL